MLGYTSMLCCFAFMARDLYDNARNVFIMKYTFRTWLILCMPACVRCHFCRNLIYIYLTRCLCSLRINNAMVNIIHCLFITHRKWNYGVSLKFCKNGRYDVMHRDFVNVLIYTDNIFRTKNVQQGKTFYYHY